MAERKMIWDTLSTEERAACIEAIISFVQNEWDEEIGRIGADQLLDTVLPAIFGSIYNKGVVDAQKVIEEQLAGVNVNLDLLKRDRG